jgi:O-antigen/teichoic acid export membrane protein
MNAARLQKDLAIWSTIDAWGRPVVGFFMAIVFGPRAVPVLAGYALAIAAGNAVFRSRTVRPREPAPVSHADPWIRDVRGGFLRYAAPLLPLAFLAWLVGIAPRYFIAGLAGAEEAGLFAAVYGLGWTPAMALAGIGQLTLRPVLFDAVSRGDEARERRTLWVWLATVGGGALVLAVVLTLLAPWVVALLLGPAYRGGAVLVPWIAWAYAMQAIQTVFETMLYAQQRTGRVLMMNALGAGVSVALYAVLVPRSGALGAGVAMFISLAVSCGAGFVAAGATRRIFAKRSA